MDASRQPDILCPGGSEGCDDECDFHDQCSAVGGGGHRDLKSCWPPCQNAPLRLRFSDTDDHYFPPHDPQPPKKSRERRHERFVRTVQSLGRFSAHPPGRFVTAAALFDGRDAGTSIMRRILRGMGAEATYLENSRSVNEAVTAAFRKTCRVSLSASARATRSSISSTSRYAARARWRTSVGLR